MCIFISVGNSMKMEAVRTLLEEAVYNVCDNAIKYNRNDGSVSVFLTQTAQEIQIVVKDTGVGIPKEDQDRVFERFYRVDKSHSKEIGGTGLGTFYCEACGQHFEWKYCAEK